MLRPTASQLLLFSCGALLFLFCESVQIPTNDLAIYLAQGREMAQQGGFADVDAFTHTVDGESFLNGTWAAQRAFYEIWRLAGWGGLQITLAFAVCGTVLLTAWGARRAGRSAQASGFAALLAAWLVVQNLGIRPQLFALPLFAAYAAIAMTVPPTLATGIGSAAIVFIWANLHGSFAVAPVLSVLVAGGVAWEHASGERSRGEWARAVVRSLVRGEGRAHLFTAAAVAAAACLNPYGASIWIYVALNTSSPASRGLSEWQRTTITDACGVRLLGSVVVIGALIAWRRRFPARRDVPAMVAFVALALTAIRHVVWTGMVLPIGFARILARAPGPADPAAAQPDPERRLPLAVGVVFFAFWGAILIGMSPWVKVRATGDAEITARFTKDTPVALTAWAAENGVRGPLFNSMEWGGFLVWRIPETTAFVDARIWIFPDDIWNEYLQISGAQGDWEDALDRREILWAVLERRFHGFELAPAMSASSRWEKVYEDETGLIFRRR